MGYGFADYYKGNSDNDERKNFIQKCNIFNLFISLFLLIICIITVCYDKNFQSWLIGITFFRVYSRSIEIVYAFGKDALSESDNKSKLTKFERIELAIRSYVEIYLYSAAFYITIIKDVDILKPLVMSLSVGSLTNVAYSQSPDLLFYDWMQLFAFCQVFSTLSLVVLSLAIYVSRKE